MKVLLLNGWGKECFKNLLLKRRTGRMAKQNQGMDAGDVFADTRGINILLKSDRFNTGLFIKGFSGTVRSPLQRLQY